MSTAADIRPGSWVRMDRWDAEWWYVHAARHTPFVPDEPQTTGFVQYDAAQWPTGGRTLGGFAVHDDTCRIVTVTPQVRAIEPTLFDVELGS